MLKSFSKIFLFGVFLTFAGLAQAQQPPQQTQTTSAWETGRIIVVQVSGEVYFFTTGETYRLALRTGSLITPGQQIATGPKASVMLAFSNGATVTIGENSVVAVDEFTQKPFGEMFRMSEAAKEPSASQTRLNLVRGEVISNVKKLNKEESSTFEIKTPVGVAGIRGTTFRIAFDPDSRKNAPNAKPDDQSASFALVMLEGVIEMQVPGRPFPIVVPQGKQLVLDDINLDAEGNVAMNDAAMEPATSSLTTNAMLLQHVQTMLSASANIAIPASPSMSNGASQSTPRTQIRESIQEQNQKKQSGETESSSENISPSPAPQNPAPRLSPTDGTGGQ